MSTQDWFTVRGSACIVTETFLKVVSVLFGGFQGVCDTDWCVKLCSSYQMTFMNVHMHISLTQQ